MGKKTLVLLLVGVGGSLGVCTWLWFSQTPSNVSRSPPPQRRTRPAIEPPDDLARFVGSRVCADCHQKISQDYARSGMARSWRTVDKRTRHDEIDNQVEDSNSGYRYRVVWEEGKLYQEETRLALRGESTHRLRLQANYIVGSGNHAQAMVTEHNGYLHQLPLGWFRKGNRWRLNPGYERLNWRFDRPITPGCVSCHGPIAQHESPTRNRFAPPLAEGISCERCHGPGKEHVEYWQATGAEGKQSAKTGMVHPGRLSANRANDVCLQCHLQGDVTVFQPGSGPFCFRPGNNLHDHRLDFLVKTEKAESFGVASHGARMMQSRCYLESTPKLTCIRCHDPHVPTSDVPPAFFDTRCVDCHQPETCSRPVKREDEKTAEGCVACHMPRRATREGQHLVFTDHWIRKRPANNQPDPPVLSPNADVELQSIWPGADPHKLRLGIAYVHLHETMGPRTRALERGIRILQRAHQNGYRDLDSSYALGSAMIGSHRGNEAVDILQSLVHKQPEHVRARFRLGIAWDQTKRYDRAIREYETVLETAPAWMEPYPLLARLYLYREQPDRVIALLEQQRKYNPDANTFAQLAMARHLRSEPVTKCLQLLDEALALDPRFVRAHLYRAHIFTTTKQFERARASYLKALEVDPQNPIAIEGLAEMRGHSR